LDLAVRFLNDLIERRIFRFVVAYVAGSWAILQVVDQFVNNGLLPGFMYRAALALVLCGLPGALIVSWFHGAKGRQEVPRIERWLLAGVALFAVSTTGFVARIGITEGMTPNTAELTATHDPRRVAVLYLDSRGGGDAEFLASGLTEALIDQLGEVEGLHVVSRNGSMLFRGAVAAPDSVGRTLQVGALVGGTVALAGDRVRVDVALTSVRNGEQIASRRIERPRSEIFALQDEVADTVAVFLRRAIGRELVSRRLQAGTRSVRAWELVQAASVAADGATTLLATGGVEAASRALEEADSTLVRAEAEDPRWAEPIIRRGWLAYRQSRLGGLERDHNERWVTRGMELADRALALEPTNPSAMELRATLIYWKYLLNLAGGPEEADRYFAEAEDGFRSAIAAAGGRLASAQNSLSHLLINKGQTAEAKVYALQAYTADPFLENGHLTLWRIFTTSWSLQDGVEARRYCDEGARRYPSDYRFRQCRLMLAALPGSPPDIDAAWAELDEFTVASPAPLRELNRRKGMLYISMALARAGMADSARYVIMAARAGTDVDPLRELAHLESITWSWLGENTEAVNQLSLYMSANPQALDGLRASVTRRELPWYHQTLNDEPALRSLVGVR
jgi:TolB-like protein